jgi:hypothetical protein
MKVLRKGTKPADVTAKFDCRECGSRLQAKRSEGELTSDWRDGDFLTFKCPECKSSINVSTELFK